MSYVALYRKFRPASFSDVKGQDAIVTTLRNQISAERIGHAYLFSGTRGTGKTSCAKVFAKAVNCENPSDGNPCCSCRMCRQIAEGRSLNVVEIDAASNNGVDQIREIVEDVTYRPAEGKYRVYIIDEVHMLSTGAFNALLKTLEEPPSYVIFILATTEAGKVPVTIGSRCQRFDFHRISAAVITDHLTALTKKEGIAAEERALQFIARKAEGSMRDALSLLDQCSSFLKEGVITYEDVLKVLGTVDQECFKTLFRALYKGDAGSAVRIFNEALNDGADAGQFLNDFIWYLRNLLVARAAEDAAPDLIDLTNEQIADLRTLAKNVETEAPVRYIRMLSALQNEIRYATDRRVLIEVALLRLTLPQMNAGGDQSALAERLRQAEIRASVMEDRIGELEQQLASGTFTMQVPPAEGTIANAAVPVYRESGSVPDMGIEQEIPHRAYAGEPGAFEHVQEKAASLPSAPDVLQAVCRNWQEIIGSLKNRFARQMLRDAVPKYDAEAMDGILYIELVNPLAERLPDDADTIGELKTVIRKRYGTDVEIRMHMRGAESRKLSVIKVSEIVRERIHMEIEEEE